ncbi:ArnT family glycosyltransferase [Erythrobacter sp. NE805]|uniref:ArnT family glycosyltransferase n=1 Tax=Erythrobacter sp. NE805 TaxID=3389875 RepID=UPI00396B23DF
MFAPPPTGVKPRLALKPRLAAADLGAVLVLALLTLLVRGAWIGDPVADFDEQLYSVIGSGMLEGKVPFTDLWDRKPWGLFAIYAFAHAIGGPGPAAYQGLAAVFTVAGAAMLYHMARDLTDRVTALGAGMLYILMLSIYGAYSANSEAFFLPMVIAMALLVRDPQHPRALARGLAAMLLGGIALQVKYTVIPLCLFLGLWVLWGQFRQGMRLPQLAALAVAFGVLGVLPTAAVAAGYAVTGRWDDFVFANFVSFFARAPGPWGRWPQPYFLGVILLIVALVLLGLNAARRKWGRAWPRAYVFAVLWFAASAATTFLPATLYLYYIAAMAPAAVLVSLPLFEREGGKGVNFAVLVPPLFYLALMPHLYKVSREDRASAQSLASAIAPLVDAEAGRCLFVFDGPTALYRMTGSCLPTRFIYPDHLNNALERGALGIRQEDEVARILATRPPVIVTAEEPLTPQNPVAIALVEQAIARDYRPLGRVELHQRMIRSWALRRP